MPKYPPHITTIVQPKGVDTSILPRPMEMGSDQSRESVVEKTSGEPLVDYEGATNPYIDYQSIDILLSLQHPRSKGYDEMCFIVMGQIKEMLFKGLHPNYVVIIWILRQFNNPNNDKEILIIFINTDKLWMLF